VISRTLAINIDAGALRTRTRTVLSDPLSAAIA
jgi:hypothetical protein